MDTPDTSTAPSHAAPTPPVAGSPVLLVAVWLVVAVPALWGVSKTVQTSLNLFNPPAAKQPATHPG